MPSVRSGFNIVLRFCLLFSVLLVGFAASAAAQDPCAGSTRLLNIGGRNTMFYGPVNSNAEVKEMFRVKADEIRTLLRQVGFTGNADDLFSAVESSSGFDSIGVERGTKVGWMFFRRRNQPTAMVDICWAANNPFDAYQVSFDSGGVRYHLAVPKICGNLALLGQEAAPVARIEPPVCTLEVEDSCESLEFSIDATGSTGEDVSIIVEGPSGRSELSASDARSPLRWNVRDEELEASFTFTAVGSTPGSNGEPLVCRDQVTIDRDCCPEGPPSISVAASALKVKVNETVEVTASPSVHDCAELRSVTIDGVRVNPPYARELSWSEPGEYTVIGQVTDDEGATAEDSVVITVVSDGGWILRGFAGPSKPADDGDWVRQRFTTVEGEFFEDHSTKIEDGWGFGAQAEYKFRDWFGLGLGAYVANYQSDFMLDTPTAWLMDHDDISTFSLFAGPLFHLTRDSRVDFFVGPFLHFTTVGDTEFVTEVGRDGNDYDDEFGVGVQLGLDFPFRADGNFGLHFGALYFDLDADAQNPNGVSFDLSPLSANVGLFYRFR